MDGRTVFIRVDVSDPVDDDRAGGMVPVETFDEAKAAVLQLLADAWQEVRGDVVNPDKRKCSHCRPGSGSMKLMDVDHECEEG